MECVRENRSVGSSPRLLVSSLSGGGGKTFLTLGLCRALSLSGYAVKAFKKGPDYIDAAWLSLAARFHATNLDPVFLQQGALTDLFIRACTARMEPDRTLFACIEGNRGLFDGVDVEGSASSAQLARMVHAPVLLSIDCTKMTRTVAAVLQGILSFEEDLSFLGVVLSRVGTERQSALIRKAVERYTGCTVFGELPRLRENPFPERHMGLASRGAGLAEDAGRRIETLASFCREHIDVARLAEHAERFAAEHPLPEESSGDLPQGLSEDRKPPLPDDLSGASVSGSPGVPSARCAGPGPLPSGERPTIGYVRDAVLWFYYEENLEDLERAGADLVELRLSDGEDAAWERLDGLFLGGGFPEDHAAELVCSGRLPLLRRLAENDLPVYAECGGFMLLSRELIVQERHYPMAGVFPVDVEFCRTPQGLGYTAGTVLCDTPFYPKGAQIIGHEFHYSRCCLREKQVRFALMLERGTGMGCHDGTCYDGLVWKNVWGSYTHIFSEAVPFWAGNFVARARAWRDGHRKNPSPERLFP